MALFTKSILSERESSDGVRISVMSRHTLSDGVTPDPRITFDKYEEHLVILSPRPKFLGDYYKRGLPWEEFELRYCNQLRHPDLIPVVQSLAIRASNQDITLLCIEEVATHCHRRLLAEECLVYEPILKIEHR